MKLFSTLAILIFITTYSSIAARNYYFRQYHVEDGLSNNNITACIQDKHGFIWIGTRDGLNRFDGYTFRNFQDTDDGASSLDNDWINSLAVNNSEELWIGTFMGLYKYNYDEENFETISFCKGMDVRNLIFDSSDNLWLLLEGRLVKYNVKLDDFQVYNIPDNGNLQSFCYTYKEKIWLVLSSGMLYSFDIASGEFQGFDVFSHSTNYKVKSLTVVSPSLDGEQLFIGATTHGAKLFDIQTGTYKDLMGEELDELEICVRGFLQTTSNEVWIASEVGLYIYDIANNSLSLVQKKSQDPYTLSTNLLSTIYKDKEDGIWLGTYSGGINYFSPVQPFQKYYEHPQGNSLKGEIVHDITVDKYSNLWIATEDEGLNKLDAKTGEYIHYTKENGEHSISHQNIHGLIADEDRLWVGSLMGIDLIDIPTGKVVTNYKVGNNETIVIMKKIQNGMLFVGTSHGMFAYNNSSDKFELIQEFPRQIRIQSILQDSNGVIWAGTFNKGLYYYNPANGTNGKFQHDTIPTKNSNTINDIYEDPDHNLWFATQEGLKKYDRQTNHVSRYTVKNGLPSNITFRILSDESNNLWVSTTNGLVCLNPETEKIKTYKKEHGLITNQFNYNSSWKDKKGMMYFGMVKGMISFFPKEIQNFEKDVQVYLTNMTVFDKTVSSENTVIPISFSKEITLHNNQSTFNISFSSLSFIAPSITEYSFYMEGLYDRWINLKDSQTAYFTKLPPGDYLFKVKSSNLTGDWNEIPATLKITVLPPWWLSKIAIIIYSLLALGCIALIFRLVRRQNKKKVEHSIKQLEYHKEKELHQSKINFFVNVAHEIRTPLTLITGSVEKISEKNEIPVNSQNYISNIKKNTDRLLKLVDQLLDFRKTELQVYKLNYVKTNIISLLEENVSRFKSAAEHKNIKLELNLNVSELYVSIDEDAFVKILSNLLLNAIKYAETYIEITLNHLEGSDYFMVTINNDGQQLPDTIKEKIFEPFYRGQNSDFKPGTGLGLPLARSLAEMHQGTLILNETGDETISFQLKLPVSHENSISLNTTPNGQKNINHSSLREYAFDETRPTVLVVEDNIEMQGFIGNEINTTFNVLTASNGKDALEIMDDFSVQLVVSDIMMPIMDGFQLLEKVKTELNHSHIPVILLTAKNTQQSKLEGLELGADAYIEKPFSVNILLAQITNLINNRDSVRKYYINSPMANLKSIAHTKADEIFLEKLNEIILENISNSKLDVDMLAEQMNMSRPTLYRKIKAVSDLTPNDLIRTCRLKKAAKYIEQGELSLNEIAENVGFNSQSYFSRSFSKQFGTTPSDYLSNIKNKSSA